MKSRRVFLFSTIISVCLCTVMTTPAFAVNWQQVGWIVANNVIDRVVNLDGQSSNDQYSTYMVSPSIVFNNGTNGGEFYMRPQVSSRVTSFEMHAHRANPVDFGANIVLALSTTSGKGLSIKQQGQTRRRTVQYIYLTALALLGLCMLIFPRQLWKISNFLWTQKGDPSNLYTSLMRISGAAFLVLALILFIFCRLQ